MMISPHLFGEWPGAIWQQAIIWTNVDKISMAPYGVSGFEWVKTSWFYNMQDIVEISHHLFPDTSPIYSQVIRVTHEWISYAGVWR